MKMSVMACEGIQRNIFLLTTNLSIKLLTGHQPVYRLPHHLNLVQQSQIATLLNFTIINMIVSSGRAMEEESEEEESDDEESDNEE